ncbi:MAG: efflux RND transporter periplasmic adaptor subunit [Pirellulaceae bacterium]|nr:efflux RND transporter periplasmic adaptor subunit [Pirellulaceae bacterium]
MSATAGRQLLPQHKVSVMSVMVSESTSIQSNTPLFQAAGWVEPRPQAVSVAALAPGVVDELLVVEGQLVERDEPIARLFKTDAALVLRQASANLALRKGELARCEAELKAASIRVEQPVHLEVQLAEANGNLAKIATELARLPFSIEAAKSAESYTKRNWQGKLEAQEGLVGRIVQHAENEHVAASTNLRELIERQPLLQVEVDALQQRVNSIKKQLELLVDEKRQMEEAQAKVDSALATVDEAKVQVEQAQLHLDRMVVAAPIRGRILKLLVSRGARLMGLETNAAQNTSTVAQMYDPSQLQVRADVRLEEVAKVQSGQLVEVRTATTSEVIKGRVLQATSSANIQKNTLEVKVELIDPPESVCPEMLVTATFMSPKVDSQTNKSIASTGVAIPRSLIEISDRGSFVWIVDGNNRAVHREITLDQTSSGELCRISSGLTPTDKLIVQGKETLTDGMSVKIIGEDKTFGTENGE